MSNTFFQDSICQAIDLITEEKIARASFDKTIKGVVNKVLDKTIGEYEIRYQDSLFPAYATSSQNFYEIGQDVSILVPGNDFTRRKIIVGGINAVATNYYDIPPASQTYNSLGSNFIIAGENFDSKTQWYNLCSYSSTTYTIYEKGEEASNVINLDTNAINKYIKQSDGIALSFTAQTNLDSLQQGGGQYGMIVEAIVNDDAGNAATQRYVVSNYDVIGNPFNLITPTKVENFEKNIDTSKFVEISKIYFYTRGFPGQKDNMPDDIFISDITINGGTALTNDQLQGYSLHIDYTKDGNELAKNEGGDDSEKTVTLQGQLKVKGRIVSSGVQYYWCRKNATVFRGSSKYLSKAGDGWQCLNPKADEENEKSSFIPYKQNTFIFSTTTTNAQERKAQALERNTQVLCVAVYNKDIWTKTGYVVNLNTKEVRISSSEKRGTQNKTDYYYGMGHPIFTCEVIDADGVTLLDTDNELYKYTWTVTSNTGQVDQKTQSSDDSYKKAYLDLYNTGKTGNCPDNLTSITSSDITDRKLGYQIQKSKVAESQQNTYITSLGNDYTNAIKEWQKQQYAERIKGKYYIYFPVNTIVDQTTITCTVQQGETYIGTASITLKNKLEVEGQYSLTINNSAQVFQYDGKGNSPCGPAVQKPLKIEPLTFTLLDNSGSEISYKSIIQNGTVRWLFPKENTLLKHSQIVEQGNSLLIDPDKTFFASYDIVKNIQTFPFTIEDKYDSKKYNNYIRLNVEYKDLVFDAYTNFSFPKDGDPGTNGTDFYAKIVPNISTQRVYLSNKEYFKQSETSENHWSTMFADDGRQITYFEFCLYNNSLIVPSTSLDNNKIFWTCPPFVKYADNDVDRNSKTTFLELWRGTRNRKSCSIKGQTGSGKANTDFVTSYNKHYSLTNTVQTYQPVNIIRAQYGNGKQQNDLIYYSEYPICTEFFLYDSPKYRIKLAPKSGFNYVVYSQDGTNPEYDNSLPFQVLLQTVIPVNNKEVWSRDDTNRSVTWYLIGNLEFDEDKNLQYDIKYNENKTSTIAAVRRKCWIKPKDNFDGLDLSSAIVINIGGIGYIHVPIYMILNRYGHSAINGWDGNSIDLGQDTGVILAPQVGAGSKNSQNQFSGVLMGVVTPGARRLKEDDNHDQDRGLFGYHNGQRTIFLDSDTGTAQFGKQGAARITLDPSLKINNKDAAVIYSGDYPIDSFLSTPSVRTIGQDSSNKDQDDRGMIIDLSTPQIGFGSGAFFVESNGHIHAGGGGDIAGWQITDSQLHKDNKVGMASSNKDVPSNYSTLKNGDNDTVAFWAGGVSSTTSGNDGVKKLKDANFYTTHGGYLFSKLGQIAGWDIDDRSIKKDTEKNGLKSSVGMNSYNEPTTSNNPNYYTVDIDKDNPTDTVDEEHFLAFWAGSGSGDSTFDTATNKMKNQNVDRNFFVTHDGYIRAKYGKIATWHLLNNALTDYQVGMSGDGVSFSSSGTSKIFGEDSISAMFWGASDTVVQMSTNYTAIQTTSNYDPDNLNFIVSHDGYLYSKAGKIAGWKIEPTSLSAENIVISSDGAIFTKGFFTNDEPNSGIDANQANKNSGWGITSDGNAYFYNLEASRSGKIGGWTIGEGSLTNASSTIELVSSGGSTTEYSKTDNKGTNAGTYIKAGSLLLSGDGTIKGSNWYINSNTDHNLNFQNVTMDSTGFSSSGTGGNINQNTKMISDSGGTGTYYNGAYATGSARAWAEDIVTKNLTVEHLNAKWANEGRTKIGYLTINGTFGIAGGALSAGGGTNGYVYIDLDKLTFGSSSLSQAGADDNSGSISASVTGAVVKTGTAQFKDNTMLQFTKGILTGVTAGEVITWT